MQECFIFITHYEDNDVLYGLFYLRTTSADMSSTFTIKKCRMKNSLFLSGNRRIEDLLALKPYAVWLLNASTCFELANTQIRI